MASARPACDHHTPLTLTRGAVDAALAAAERRCLSAGERWTPPRRRTYELLVTNPGPRKAYDLIAAFKRHAATTKPPTVYRSLDFLVGLGLVHRVESLNAFVACTGSEPTHTPEFLICDCCGQTEEMSAGPVSMPSLAAGSRFEVRHLVIELHGTCGACRVTS